jgi:hypothetical protein
MGYPFMVFQHTNFWNDSTTALSTIGFGHPAGYPGVADRGCDPLTLRTQTRAKAGATTATPRSAIVLLARTRLSGGHPDGQFREGRH